jgi:hypothetical protein
MSCNCAQRDPGRCAWDLFAPRLELAGLRERGDWNSDWFERVFPSALVSASAPKLYRKSAD